MSPIKGSIARLSGHPRPTQFLNRRASKRGNRWTPTFGSAAPRAGETPDPLHTKSTACPLASSWRGIRKRDKQTASRCNAAHRGRWTRPRRPAPLRRAPPVCPVCSPAGGCRETRTRIEDPRAAQSNTQRLGQHSLQPAPLDWGRIQRVVKYCTKPFKQLQNHSKSYKHWGSIQRVTKEPTALLVSSSESCL